MSKKELARDLVTLVPAFKVAYFEPLLRALAQQTLRPARVLVSDDSPGGDFLAFSQREEFRDLVDGLDIAVVEGPRKGHYANIQSLARQLPESCRFFHILCDDDLLYPLFYQQHYRALSSSKVLCSISKRWVAGEDGQPLAAAEYPQEVADARGRLQVLEADFLWRSILPGCNNWLGEFSNVLFRRQASAQLARPVMDGLAHFGLYDLGTFLHCAQEGGGLLLINEHLGAFRRSAQQFSSQTASPVFRLSIAAWLVLASAAWRRQAIDEAHFKYCLKIVCGLLHRHFAQDPLAARLLECAPVALAGDVDGFIDKFRAQWPGFLAFLDAELLPVT